MKEISIEEKAKAYDEAIERASNLHKDAVEMENKMTTKTCEIIFPELAESEDERMIQYFKDLAPFDKADELYEKYGFSHKDAIAWLEKQGEQKPTDKVEPKFHKEEWLIENHPNNYARFVQILEIVNVQGKDGYRISRDLHNDEDIVECRFIEDNWHSFNIKDAKDGDVLYSIDSKQPFIYKERPQFSQAIGYCCINIFGEFAIWNTSKCVICTDKYIPATKEQRDTLLKAMADAGYTFDFEKRELKKIEQKPEWSEEEYISYILTNCMNYAEKMGYVEEKNNRYIHQNAKLWLKSLKDRYTWKPSNEQMNALNAINVTGCISYAGQGQELINLYNDLKKLKE